MILNNFCWSISSLNTLTVHLSLLLVKGRNASSHPLLICSLEGGFGPWSRFLWREWTSNATKITPKRTPDRGVHGKPRACLSCYERASDRSASCTHFTRIFLNWDVHEGTGFSDPASNCWAKSENTRTLKVHGGYYLSFECQSTWQRVLSEQVH